MIKNIYGLAVKTMYSLNSYSQFCRWRI